MILGKPCVFVDLETTGTNANSEAITEVGLRFCEIDGSTRDWQQLVNPGRSIPGFIQRLTGITDALVRDQPYFSDIATELHSMLDGYVMIAHNARFDYGFLKHAFESCDFQFKPQLLCTVKLSRALYPGVKGHSLDAICSRIGFVREQAHRALEDVAATHAFVCRAVDDLGQARVDAAAKAQFKRPAQPAQLAMEEVNRIPNTPGVYRFYGSEDALLYVGKSVRMRERVMSHFSADIRAAKEMRLAQEVRHVDWHPTAGELGALLQENYEIKEKSPIYNRRQRRHKQLWCFQLIENEGQATRVELTARPLSSSNEAMPASQTHTSALHGLFTTKSAATKWLASAIDEHKLCKQLMGMEHGSGSCFNYQLRRCAGACVGDEPVAAHNLRLRLAFGKQQLQRWPFNGAAAIIEQADDWRDAECSQQDIHIIDHWVYLGTVHDVADIPQQLNRAARALFDRETYSILNKWIHRAVPVEELLLDSVVGEVDL